MTPEVSSRVLRSSAAAVLRRVQAGERIVITRYGKPVAALVPVEAAGRRWLPREELVKRLARAQADPGLRDDLEALTA
jgi:prevent-host-death family protein